MGIRANHLTYFKSFYTNSSLTGVYLHTIIPELNGFLEMEVTEQDLRCSRKNQHERWVSKSQRKHKIENNVFGSLSSQSNDFAFRWIFFLLCWTRQITPEVSLVSLFLIFRIQHSKLPRSLVSRFFFLFFTIPLKRIINVGRTSLQRKEASVELTVLPSWNYALKRNIKCHCL